MVIQTIDQIVNSVLNQFNEKKVVLAAPVVKGRKGHYKELFIQIRKKGFTNVRVDGEIIEIERNFQLDRYTIHDIEIVIDKLKISQSNIDRLKESIDLASVSYTHLTLPTICSV